MQTGLPRGTWKRHDKHPEVDGRTFGSYKFQNGRTVETWETKESLEKQRLRQGNRYKEKRLSSPARARCNTKSKRGTYKMWDEHPEFKGMFFCSYYTDPKGVWKEHWFTKDKLEERQLAVSMRQSVRGRLMSNRNLSSNESRQVKMFYKIRNIKNKAHGKAMYHVDHITPLSKGGSHCPSNLQLATAKWNQSKSDKIL